VLKQDLLRATESKETYGKTSGTGGDISGIKINYGGDSITEIKSHIDRSTNVDNRGGLIQRSSIGGGEERIRICPYCGKELNFPKPPRFCPYCGEQLE
jgi:rubrerythrin